MSQVKRRVLGRGLSALLPGSPVAPVEPEAGDDTDAAGETAVLPPPPAGKRAYFMAQIEEVYPSAEQPRKRFEEGQLVELADSIRAHGIIQPLIVRPRPERDGGGFLLIAGERRWRAAQRAGLAQVPVVVQEVDSTEAFERALVENLQRADLNPLEEAEAYRRLVDELGYTQEQIAERVGKERSTISNSLRLLKLPPAARKLLEEEELSMGHARALLGLEAADDIDTLARNVVARKLSVRATEELVRKRLRGGGDAAARPAARKSPAVRDLETRLTRALGAQVSLAEDKTGRGGTIEIRYVDLDDLDRLLERLLGPA
ncbi:MAG TPA: ParB/RepB/Spo0J family partition protein [Kofleriaceae bacterium]|nr:ParB/RepB/Spo0J family partition protein [Kofleriaceae bacterium]